jgi:endogenous inhibitor of DNA gyrase (YacG/DUF329 family)
MAMVQLECPETGKPIDIGDVPPERAHLPMALVMKVEEVPCPHCGKGHRWSSSHVSQAMIVLRDSPAATRILVHQAEAQDGQWAVALP